MKQWKKPTVFTLTAKELSKHIKAAAWSGLCPIFYFK